MPLFLSTPSACLAAGQGERAGIPHGGLEIQHGLVAAIDFGRMIAENTSAEEKEATREALLAYCQRDTEAMVRVFDVLSSMTT